MSDRIEIKEGQTARFIFGDVHNEYIDVTLFSLYVKTPRLQVHGGTSTGISIDPQSGNAANIRLRRSDDV